MLLCLPLFNVVTVCPPVSILFDTLSRLIELIFSISVSESNDFVSNKLNALISFNFLKSETEICLRIVVVIFTVVQIYHHY